MITTLLAGSLRSRSLRWLFFVLLPDSTLGRTRIAEFGYWRASLTGPLWAWLITITYVSAVRFRPLQSLFAACVPVSTFLRVQGAWPTPMPSSQWHVPLVGPTLRADVAYCVHVDELKDPNISCGKWRAY